MTFEIFHESAYALRPQTVKSGLQGERIAHAKCSGLFSVCTKSSL